MIRKALLLVSVARHLSLVSSSPSSLVKDTELSSATGDEFRHLEDAALCRCQADFEHFYDRRLQGNDESNTTATNRYGEVHIDIEGYYHIDGVKVLNCKATTRSADVEHSVIKSLSDLFNRDGDEESSNGGFRQRLLGSKSSKSGSSKSSTYYGGKGKGKGGGYDYNYGKGKGKGSTPSLAKTQSKSPTYYGGKGKGKGGGYNYNYGKGKGKGSAPSKPAVPPVFPCPVEPTRAPVAYVLPETEPPTLFIEPEEACLMDVTLTCQGSVGGSTVACRDITGEKEPQCTCDQCARELRFRFTGSKCQDSSGSSCVDSAVPMPTDKARIIISSATGNIYNGEVARGDDVVVRNNGQCVSEAFTISVAQPGTLNIAQQVAVDTGCNDGRGIVLGDAIGAVDFSGFTCEDNEAHNCFVDVLFGACAVNIGSGDMTLTDLVLSLDGSETDLLVGVDPEDLLLTTGQEYCNDSVNRELDRCDDAKSTVAVFAQSDDDAQIGCQAQDGFEVLIEVGSIPPSPAPSPSPTPRLTPRPTPRPTSRPTPRPTPRPTRSPTQSPSEIPTLQIVPEACRMDVTLTCQGTDDSNVDCTNITGEQQPQCSCDTCARELRFRYTGAKCQAPSGRSDFNCVDASSVRLPADQARVVITSSVGYLYDDEATTDEDILLMVEGRCLPEDLTISIAQLGTANIAQQISKFETGCNGRGIVLQDSIGALDFTGYTCENNEAHNCFVDVEYDVCAENIGFGDMTLTDFIINVDGTETDLLSSVRPADLLLSPGEEYCGEKQIQEINRCEDGSASFAVSAESDDEFQIGCGAQETHELDITVGSAAPSPSPSSAPSSVPTILIVPETEAPTPVPTPAPTRSPTPAPTPAPTAIPTVQPSSEPSPSPSSTPSAAPSKTPSSMPSPAPSAEPSSGPSAQPSVAPSVSAAPSVSPSMEPTQVPCELDIQISCVNTQNTPCETMVPPSNGNCATGPIGSLTFSYRATNCDFNANQQDEASSCQDFLPNSTPNDVAIVCVDGSNQATAMTVSPPVVSKDGYFTVTNPSGPLPSSLFCNTLDTTSGEMNQAVSIDTSGSVELDLKDRYGAFQVESCDEKTCLESVIYAAQIANIGTKDTEITELQLTFQNNTADLLVQITNPVLSPGASARVSNPRVIDTCTTGEYTASVTISGYPEGDDGGMCQADDDVVLAFDSQCYTEVTVTCQGVDDSDGIDEIVDCSQITGEMQPQCYCSECARELRFRFTGAACQMDGDYECIDDPTVPMPTDRARIVVTSKTAIHFDGEINVGEDVIVTTSSCLPEVINLNAAQPGTENISQEISSLDTGCRGRGIVLQESFGAFDFVGYTCDNNEAHNCFIDVKYNMCAENEGFKDSTVSSFLVNFDGVETNLLAGVDPTELSLVPGQEYCSDSIIQQIDRCEDKTYVTTVFAEADGATQLGCEAQETHELEIVIGSLFPSPVPSAYPSALPSAQPSLSPSAAPSPRPSANPTASPTPMPSPAPTPRPTRVPTLAPTPVPTRPPTRAPTLAPTRAPTLPPTQVPTALIVEETFPPTRRPTRAPTQVPTLLIQQELPVGCPDPHAARPVFGGPVPTACRPAYTYPSQPYRPQRPYGKGKGGSYTYNYGKGKGGGYNYNYGKGKGKGGGYWWNNGRGMRGSKSRR